VVLENVSDLGKEVFGRTVNGEYLLLIDESGKDVGELVVMRSVAINEDG
jgi:hypothetical protein